MLEKLNITISFLAFYPYMGWHLHIIKYEVMEILPSFSSRKLFEVVCIHIADLLRTISKPATL